MNLPECLLTCFSSQQSLIVETSKFKNTESLQNIISHYTDSCSILYCTKNTTPIELLVFFVSPSSPIPKTKTKLKNQSSSDEEDEEETITEIILSKKPTTNRLVGVSTHHFNKKNMIEIEKETNEIPYLQNDISILYNIDKLSKKSQITLMEIMIHKKFQIKGKEFHLNPKLMVFSTATSISNLNSNLLNQFLLFCSLENKDISNNSELKSLQSSFQSISESSVISRYCRDIIVSVRLQPDVIQKPLTNSIKCLEIASKGFAILNSKSYVTSNDVMSVAPNVLAHRIQLRNGNSLEFIQNLVKVLPYS
jgi:MoxR-like ATPase